ncbi:SIMPL domain-containing protein [Rhizorhapis sp.]|uniref:SIMPL domain-containing protein n=1 Tax=Rhizorhapis sp. TaxID=1968842 RepID=UPI002B4675D2|nr:SIMPL domain-containing protein [Rhizorhapis sp.]HKR16485.1 SIMPL domain-containing protein [Rhizorhapis sp.]
MSDPETTANIAYTNAYKAARRRAEAYAEAAGMKVSRILYIRDAGGSQGTRYLPPAEVAARVEAAPPAVSLQAAPPPTPEQGGARIMARQTTSDVSIQVDFALQPQ